MGDLITLKFKGLASKFQQNRQFDNNAMLSNDKNGDQAQHFILD